MDPSAHSPREEDLTRHVEFLRRLARKLVDDEHAAEDAAQETALAYLSRPPAEAASTRAWFARVIRRRASNAYRAEHRRLVRERGAARPEAVEPAATASGLEAQRVVLAAVQGLEEPYRTSVWLRFYEDLPPRRIAERLGVPVETVKTRLKRALARLRRDLDGQFDGDRGAWCVALAPLVPGWRTALVSGTAAISGGAMMLKVLGLAAGVIAAALLLWFALPAGDVAEPTGVSAEQRPDVALVAPPKEAQPEPVPQSAPVGEARTAIAAPAAAQAPEPYGSLAARVLWADGTPAENVLVTVIPWGDPLPHRRRERARTDGEGRALFPRLHAGRVLASVLRGARGGLELAPGEQAELVIQLEAATEVRGRVVDGDGAAVPGAWIWLGGQFNWSDGWLAGTADAAGRFELRDVDSQCYLGARAPGFAPSPMLYLAEVGAASGPRIEVELVLSDAGGAVRGIALAPDGEPVAGAQILIGPAGGISLEVGTMPPPMVVETDEGGAFLYRGIAAGTQPIAALAEHYPVWEGRVEVLAGETTYAEVRFDNPVTVSGLVTGAKGPLAEVTITAHRQGAAPPSRNPFPPPRAESDDEGHYILELVSPGELELRASAPSGSREGEATTRLTALPGELVRWDAVLSRGLVIEGIVVDEYGQPCAQWRVSGVPQDWSGNWIQDRTDETGSFILTGCADVLYTLKASGPGHEGIFPRVCLEGVSPGGPALELIAFESTRPSARIVGRLLGPDGAPVTEGTLLVDKDDYNGSPMAYPDATTGEFAFEDLPPGNFVVRLIGVDGQTLLTSDPVVLEADATADVGTLVLGASGTLTVHARMDERLGAEHVRLELSNPDNRTTRSLERDGDTWRGELPPGTYDLHFWNGGAAEATTSVTVEEGEQVELSVDIELGRDVRLAVAAEDGIALTTRVTVAVFDENGELVTRRSLRPRTDVETLKLSICLAAGAYVVEATDAEGHRAQAPVSVDFSSPPTATALTLR